MEVSVCHRTPDPIPIELEAEWAPQLGQTFKRREKYLAPTQIQTKDCPPTASLLSGYVIPAPTAITKYVYMGLMTFKSHSIIWETIP
jgi:hypothetical protein